jgi:hypothetical protein
VYLVGDAKGRKLCGNPRAHLGHDLQERHLLEVRRFAALWRDPLRVRPPSVHAACPAHHVDACDDVEGAGGVAKGIVRDERLGGAEHSLEDRVAPLPNAQSLAKLGTHWRWRPVLASSGSI